MSFQSMLASANAAWIASAPISMADLPSKRPNGCRPTPIMATSFISASSASGRREGKGHDLVALVVGGKRHHGQLDVHAELQLRGVAFGEAPLDADHVTELDQTHPEGDK